MFVRQKHLIKFSFVCFFIFPPFSIAFLDMCIFDLEYTLVTSKA